MSRVAAAPDTAGSARMRRRVGWRKGADVDEELWPAEAFGGISDEQFWDDLASDKPLATTARTASGVPQSRSPEAVPAPQGTTVPAPQGTTVPAPQGSRASSHRLRAPAPGLPGLPGLPQGDQGATQVIPAARRRADAEDPLTSAAFALRASGPVDGRSFLPPRGAPEPGRADAPYQPGTRRGGTTPYPRPERPYREPAPPGTTDSAKTPPYGERYGIDGRHANPAVTAADPRRPAGLPRHGRDEHDAPRPPYANGYPRGHEDRSGGYPGNPYQGGGAHQGNGYRAPGAPWGTDRR
jgi:hypothetical protein